MDELLVGDKVLAVDKEGKPMFDDVYFFGHADHDREEEYISVHTDVATEPIMISSYHFIPVCKFRPCRWEERLQIYAERIQVGDLIWVNSPVGLGAKQVLSVGRLVSKGALNPYTVRFHCGGWSRCQCA